MWYFILIPFLVICIFLGTKLACQSSKEGSENNNSISINSIQNQNDSIKAMFSRKQIDEKLKHLAETPAPKKLSFGAECYKMAYSDNSVYEYFCPVCGEKTVYKKDKHPEKEWFIQGLEKSINSCRREIEFVKGVNIKLDEKEFCNHCSSNAKDPKMYLQVNIAGQTDTTKISGFNYMDIRLITEFLNDKLIHRDAQDFESPLKDKIGRIKELLGLK
jgi:hypothetical protein